MGITRIFKLAAPIIVSMWAFNFSGIIETIFISRFGETSLAAAGITNFIMYFACSIAIGLGIGVQTETAHRLGQNRSFLARPLNAGIGICLCVTILFSLVIFWASPLLISQFTSDPAVLALAIPFTKLKLLGLWAFSLVFIFRGYWMAIQRPIPAFTILVFTNGMAVIMDALLMFGLFGLPKLGFLGAGVGFSLAGVLGSSTFIIWSLLDRQDSGFFRRLPSWKDLLQVLKLGTPAGAQEGIVAIGLALLILVFGKIGTTEQAVGNVLIQLSTLLVLPGIGFGLAAHALTGEAYGKSDIPAVKYWSKQIAIAAFGFCAVISFFLIIFSTPILNLFLPTPEEVHIAHLPFIIDLITITLFSVGIVFEYTLKGMGKMVLSLMISTTLYLALIIPVFGLFLIGIPVTILRIWIFFAVFNTVYFSIYWIARRWVIQQEIKILKATGITERLT